MLSNNQIIEFLNDNFINTWVPNAELGRIHSLRELIAKKREREGQAFDTTHPLAQAIIKGWKAGAKKGSPVDCFVISSAFELMGRQLVHDLREDSERSESEYYLAFLKEALEGKQPGLGNIVLSSEQPSQVVLDLFRTPTGGNHQDYTVVVIDASAFENGGTLTIDIEVGRDEGEGGFYLFDGDTELSTEEETPKDILARTWVESGATRQLTHRFDRGQLFKLGATGYWDREEPCVNAFRATVSVQANSNKDTSDAPLTGLNVVLDGAQPSQEVLDIFRAPGNGYQDYTVVNIDTTAFEDGGMLTIDIQVGNADASGSFDLFDSGTELPTEGIPEALISAWGINPGKAGQISHRFERGEVFKLGATGDWFSQKGSINAFQAKISVEEN